MIFAFGRRRFVLANYVVMGVLIARQRSGAVLMTQLALNLSNIGLNILLGLELGWGVQGVAWASVFATFLATAIGLWFLFGEGFVRRRLPSSTQFFDFAYWRRAAGNARDLAIRVIFLELVAIFERRMDAYGPTTLDAAIALAQLINVTAFFIDGFAFATESYVGKVSAPEAASVLACLLDDHAVGQRGCCHARSFPGIW